MPFIKPFFVILLVTFCFQGISQEFISPKTTLDVNITSVEKMRKKLHDITVVLYTDDKKVDSTVLEKGKYILQLDTGHVYRVYFKKPGYVTKYVVLNTKDAPKHSKKRTRLKIDIGLFLEREGLEVDFLKTSPIGYARYDFITEKMDWNEDYLEQMRGKIVRATLDYAKKKYPEKQ